MLRFGAQMDVFPLWTMLIHCLFWNDHSSYNQYEAITCSEFKRAGVTDMIPLAILKTAVLRNVKPPTFLSWRQKP